MSSSGLRSSGPCMQCLKVIKLYGIKCIIFSNDDGTFHNYNTRDYTSNHITSGYRHTIHIN
uniref:CMP/dCMP-type deaminase domain-containing protein n=1 Tax=viral metagenome TaxID=1070528 RepID=A0A6C0JV56_9ZZZZ